MRFEVFSNTKNSKSEQAHNILCLRGWCYFGLKNRGLLIVTGGSSCFCSEGRDNNITTNGSCLASVSACYDFSTKSRLVNVVVAYCTVVVFLLLKSVGMIDIEYY